MSFWSYINGTIIVEPMGRTQAEKKYILDTVLEHLPRVTGSERDMDIYTIQKNGFDSSSSCDEFGKTTNNLVDMHGTKTRESGWLHTQDQYIIIVNGSLRDRLFEQTLNEFMKWLCRLSKRITVKEVLVNIREYDKEITIKDNCNIFYNMFEQPTWCTNGNQAPNWCEYLMWERMDNSFYPRVLGYKYIDDEENDKKVEAWISK